MKTACALLVGIALLVSGCANVLGPLRSAWNTTNAGAVDAEIKIGAKHQADLDLITGNDALTKEQKLEAVDLIEARWAPAYEAYRVLRAVLASTRAALLAAELEESPDAAKLAALVQELLAARDAVEGAIP